MNNLSKYTLYNSNIESQYITQKQEEERKKINAQQYEKAKLDLEYARSDVCNNMSNSTIPNWTDSFALMLKNDFVDTNNIDDLLESKKCILLTRNNKGIIIGWLNGNEKEEINIINNITDVHDLRLYSEQKSNIPLLRYCKPGHRISMYIDENMFSNKLSCCGFNVYSMHDIIDFCIKHRQAQRDSDERWGNIPASFDGFSFSKALMFNIEIHRNKFNYKIGSQMFTDLIAIDIARGKSTQETLIYYTNKQIEEQQIRKKIIKRKEEDDRSRARAANNEMMAMMGMG